MFCPRCNNLLEEQAAFCGECGALIKPKRDGETALEMPDSTSPSFHAGPEPTVYAAPLASIQQHSSTMLAPEYRLPDERSASRGGVSDALLPHTPFPHRKPQRNSSFFVFLAIIVIVALVIGGIAWFLARTGPTTTAQVSFLDSQDGTPGTTNALKMTVTSLPNPPDGSEYDAWLIDTTNEQILSLGNLSKSDPTTFTLLYPNDSLQSRTNLVGAGNKIEVTQEQSKVTVPTGKVVLSATFPPLVLVHIRHLLFKFPTTPGNVGLLPGLVNEIQKINLLSRMLQSNATSSNTDSIDCIAQAIVNVIEGNKGTNFHPLAANCAHFGIGNAAIGDGFGILGNGYIATAANHTALAASQSDTTDNIRLYAKDVQTSTASIKVLVTKIDNDALQLLTNPIATDQVAEMLSLSDHAYHGFDQNGNGKIEPIVGEAGALSAYTSGQRMAALTLS